MTAGSISIVAAMKLILLVSTAVGVSTAILAWRERPEPGSIPLVFLLAGQSWWSITILFRMNASNPGSELFWLKVSWIGTVVIPVAWLFFSLEYTGYHQYVRIRYIALVSLVPALTVVISLTNGYHQLLYLDTTTEQSTLLAGIPGVWHWVIAGYTYLLGLLGAIPLLQFITGDADMFRGQSLVLLLGLSIPWMTNILYLLGVLPTASVDPTPAAFAVSGVIYLDAITRFRIFETNPAPIRGARATVFERMQDGALVVNSHNLIVEMNTRAEQILGRYSNDMLGTRIEEVIPNVSAAFGDHSTSSQSMFQPESTTATYDISVTRLTNARGQTTGRIITLHDITEYIRQQQRLEVLNRVFRHNVRTSTQVIIGKAEYLANHNSEAATKTVQENAIEIEQISQKVRTVLDMFEQSREQTQPVPLNSLLTDYIATIRDQYPDITIKSDLSDEQVYVSSVLESVFSNLLENAAEHNTNPDPRVWVDVQTTETRAQVVVADNGPGIDDQELSLFNEGRETALEHGTGFGPAFINWGTAIAGGDLTFEDNDPTGLAVTVDIPLYRRDEHI